MTGKKKPAKTRAANGVREDAPLALTRDAILAVDDLIREEVRMPEWGGTVWVRSLTGAERDAWEMLAFTVEDGIAKANEDNVRARLAALTVCDEKGDLIFTIEDIEALGQKSATAMNRLYDAASRVNAVSNADIEELAGN